MTARYATSAFLLATLLIGPLASAEDAHHPPKNSVPAAAQNEAAPAAPKSDAASAPQRGMDMMTGAGQGMGAMGSGGMMSMMEMMMGNGGMMAGPSGSGGMPMGQGAGMPPRMGMNPAAAGTMGPEMMVRRVEGRIAFLRAELKIADAQAKPWNEFAEALRANAKTLAAWRAGAGKADMTTLSQRLELQEHWIAARLDGVRRLKSSFAQLAAALSDEQKKLAEELVPPHVGLMPHRAAM
ncbi:MAG: hypothetical protein EXQ91_03235 [Alphaproteobacteria bacterium]|nr:hypothetical protein [Alphaproteobacteria bacterium]